MQKKSIHLDIDGMTCMHCQTTIEGGLCSAEGVVEASVHYREGTADIIYDAEKISKEDIIKIIEELTYEVVEKDKSMTTRILDPLCDLLIIGSIYILLEISGILNRMVPARLAETGMGYGMLFVIGLITSLHCIAMCGGIGLSQSLPQNTNGRWKKTENGTLFFPAFSYNAGRVVSYSAIGFVLGFFGMLLGGGSEIGISMVLQGCIKILAGGAMILMGLRQLGTFPFLRQWYMQLPFGISKFIGMRRATAKGPFAIGLLNGFMPCGPLQSMWVVAFATGNPLAGALSMFLFSLGTVPLMLGLGSVVMLLGRKFTKPVMKTGAVLVVVLGLAMLTQGGRLSGMFSADITLYVLIFVGIFAILMSLPGKKRWMRYAVTVCFAIVAIGAVAFSRGSGIAVEKDVVNAKHENVVDGVQIVNSTLGYGDYPTITVQKDIPVRWTIHAPEGTLNGCNYRMILREYGIMKTLDYGDNVIEFTPEQSGTIPYSCWMGMVQGTIIVNEG